jgi:FKBP-type peptidyl-prolyl cis-trans isomerase
VFGLLIIATLLMSCSQDIGSENNSNKKSIKTQQESLIKANKYLVKSERTEIDNYIRRHQLTVVETGSGLKYQILKAGGGVNAKNGDIVTLKYKVKLITGNLIYSSEESGPLQFELGHSVVESGLEEALLNMKVGDEAIIIIPSHLAHGLLGDNKKIPQRSTVIYEIEFTNIN